MCFVGHRYFGATSHLLNKAASDKEVSGIPYSSVTIGIPRELFPNEHRVALTPQNTSMLLKKGFSRVLVEKDAGKEAQFPDEHYAAAGATLVNRQDLLSMTDIMLKVRPPLLDEEARHIKEGSTILSLLYPVQNKAIVDTLSSRKVNAFAVSFQRSLPSNILIVLDGFDTKDLACSGFRCIKVIVASSLGLACCSMSAVLWVISQVTRPS